MSTKIPLAELSVPPSGFTPAGVEAIARGSGLVLSYEVDRDAARFRGGLRFEKVRAYRWRAESHCTGWHVEGVYDTLAEVENSEWVAELTMVEPEDARGFWVMHHFMLYVDDDGCYEVAAESWEMLSEEIVRERLD